MDEICRNRSRARVSLNSGSIGPNESSASLLPAASRAALGGGQTAQRLAACSPTVVFLFPRHTAGLHFPATLAIKCGWKLRAPLPGLARINLPRGPSLCLPLFADSMDRIQRTPGRRDLTERVPGFLNDRMEGLVSQGHLHWTFSE